MLSKFFSVLLLVPTYQKINSQDNANPGPALGARQQNIITIAAFTAKGKQAELNRAIHEGLNAGLTVNEVKEIIVHAYAYAGFPAQPEWSKYPDAGAQRARTKRN